jgi:hypothetical protein
MLNLVVRKVTARLYKVKDEISLVQQRKPPDPRHFNSYSNWWRSGDLNPSERGIYPTTSAHVGSLEGLNQIKN